VIVVGMVEVSRQDGAIILKFTESQLQMYIIPQLKTSVTQYLEEKPAHVIFDMEGVEHLDSSAMGAIFHFQRKIREYGGKLVLIHVSPKIMQVFKITKSDAHLDMFETLEQALKAK
jgi:anti-sigma B factor antagonist